MSTMLRDAQAKLDSDNLAFACKAGRDGIAKALGIDPALARAHPAHPGRDQPVAVVNGKT